MTQNTGEWGTPPQVIKLARRIMGGIDLDPASSPRWNRAVGASRIWTKEDDGLNQPWSGRVFLNPPGEYPGAFAEWWKCLHLKMHSQVISGFFLVGYSLDHLRNPCMDQYSLIVPRKRVNYVGAGNSAATGSFFLHSYGLEASCDAMVACNFLGGAWS